MIIDFIRENLSIHPFQVRPYVTDEELQKKLQREVDWTAYKHLVVKEIYARQEKNRIAASFNH